MTHNPQPGDILISLTNGEELGTGHRAISLRIEDEMTGKFLVYADMDGPQFATLVTFGSIEVHGFLIEVTGHRNSVLPVELTVSNTADRIIVEVDISGEDYAAILGNKVTRLSNARIFAQNVGG